MSEESNIHKTKWAVRYHYEDFPYVMVIMADNIKEAEARANCINPQLTVLGSLSKHTEVNKDV